MKRYAVLLSMLAVSACGRAALSTADGGTIPCGGIGGLSCQAGQVCEDDPRDQCRYGVDPDCAGLCYPK